MSASHATTGYSSIADYLAATNDTTELACGLEYELARYAWEVKAGLSKENRLSRFAKHLKAIVPQFPSGAWLELHDKAS